MVILLRANDLLPDPRVEKYLEFLSEKKIKYKVLGWNRDNKKIYKKNTEYFNLESSHGDGNKNIKKLIKWNCFLLRELIKNRKNYKTIHACDFDTILPALFMKIFGKNVIFDIFDWYSSSRNFSNSYLKLIISFLENLSVKYSNQIIICEEERKKQIKNYKKIKKIKVFPNIPNVINFSKLLEKNEEEIELEKKILISYVGILSEERGLEELLKVVSENKKIVLNIAGFGNLEKIVEEYSKHYENIKYFSKVEYVKGLEIMKKSHLIYAMYYKTNSNHIYAAPNKYYESLFLNCPIITTKDTLVGNKVLKEQTGFVIDEGSENLKNFLEKEITSKKLYEYKKKCNEVWESKYKNYVNNFLEKIYIKIINNEE